MHRAYLLPLILAVSQLCVKHARGDTEVEPPATVQDRADTIHTAIRKGVRGLGDRLDRFFADERVEAEAQKSRLRVRPTVEWLEGGETEQSVPVRLSVVLPRLERKWQLAFTQVEDRDDDLIPDQADVVPGTSDSLPDQDDTAEDATSTFVTLSYTPVAKTRRNVKLSAGPKYRGGSIELFTALRLRLSRRVGMWKPRLTQSFFYDGDEFGERTRVDFDRPLSDELLFRSATTATYTESSEGAELVQTLLLRRFLGADKAVQTSVSAAGNTRPVTSVDRYVAAVRYRQKFWKKWLVLSVRPEVRYPRDADFTAEPALIISLEATF